MNVVTTLERKLAEEIANLRNGAKAALESGGSKVIDQVTLSQAFGGMRGVRALVCDTSSVDPETGLFLRGRPIRSLEHLWPEDTFFLLLTGEEASPADRKEIQDACDARAGVPRYVWDALRALPRDSHPMAILCTGILAMERESVFRADYDRGLTKTDFWRPMLADAFTLLPRVTELAAGIYRIRYDKGDPIPWTRGLDMGANLAHMFGVADPEGRLASLMRLYVTFHSDHGGGNVSNFTALTVGSALSDAYYAIAAGLAGLAGPLHGLANQECLKWILGVMEQAKGVPSAAHMREAAWETLNAGRVIPGYGHGVLRAIDPRFLGLLDWGKKHLADDPVFQSVVVAYETIPGVLKEHGKAQNPWPNVDAGSGALLYHFGLREFEYYTVLFAVSRTVGILSQLILNRGLMLPIVRPKAVATRAARGLAGA